MLGKRISDFLRVRDVAYNFEVVEDIWLFILCLHVALVFLGGRGVEMLRSGIRGKEVTTTNILIAAQAKIGFC